MDILLKEMVMLRKLWADENQRVALKKIIINSLSNTQIQVKELTNMWEYIDNVLKLESEDDVKKGSDEPI